MKNSHSVKYLYFTLLIYIVFFMASFSTLKPRGFDSDDSNYIRVFNSIKFDTSYFFQEMEPTYILVSKVLHYFGANYEWMLLFFSAFGLTLKFISVYKFYNKIRGIYLFLISYFLFLYWFHDLTQIRISFSLGLFLYATTLRYKNFIKYFLLIVSLLTHYSIIPAIFLLIYRDLFELKIHPKYRFYFGCLFYLSILLTVVYTNSLIELKYGEGNYPSIYYLLHPYSISILFSLFILRRNNRTIFYYLSLFYYIFFISYLLSNSQIAAFRFIEIAYFFILIDICKKFDTGWKNFKALFCLIITTFTFSSYAFFFSSQSSFDFLVLNKWINSGFGVF